MADYKIILSENNDNWDKFQDDSSEGSVYLYSNYINSLNIDNEKIYLKDNENNLLASAVIFKNFNRIPYSMYQGISIANFNLGNQKETAKRFLIISEFIRLILINYDKVFFTLSPNFYDLRPFQWINFHEENKPKFKFNLRYTAIIYLDKFENYDHYLTTIRNNRKRNLKQADKYKLIVAESKDIELFMGLYKKTFERQNIEVPNLDLVKSIIDNSIKFNYGRMTICFDDKDKAHSGIVTLTDKTKAFYAFGASDPIYRKSNSFTLLMAESIKKAFDLKLKQFDMCGANSPNRGDFKLSFNANLVQYFEASYSS